ncbi:MAG TPA: hypothetical protein VKX41_08075 [Alloacidobacterium sp.]|nr:hypothetical protein [Alloacidobacterium sp.]
MRVLCDQPGCFRAIFAGDFFMRPAVFGYDFAEAGGVPAVHDFHFRNVEAP